MVSLKQLWRWRSPMFLKNRTLRCAISKMMSQTFELYLHQWCTTPQIDVSLCVLTFISFCFVLAQEAITDGLEIAVSPRSLHSELMCPICLDMLKNTMTTKECLHRFCADCIITALRSGWVYLWWRNQESPLWPCSGLFRCLMISPKGGNTS